MKETDAAREEHLQRLARAVREARSAAGLTIRQAGSDAGTGLRGWHAVEQGSRDPGTWTLARMARAVGVSASYLLARAETQGGS